jgi:hypothetical protein
MYNLTHFLRRVSYVTGKKPIEETEAFLSLSSHFETEDDKGEKM